VRWKRGDGRHQHGAERPRKTAIGHDSSSVSPFPGASQASYQGKFNRQHFSCEVVTIAVVTTLRIDLDALLPVPDSLKGLA
jgi:hypothetical protein